MSPVAALAWGLVVLMAVLLCGVPIFLGFLLLNLAGVWTFFGSTGLGLLVNSIVDSMSSLSLSTIPLFILMGEILFRSGAVEVVFDSVDQIIGRIRGRLYVFTLVLSTLFAALCGSAAAVVALLGRSVLPVMKNRGYDIELSAGVILGGASLAPIIPPSVLAVIIGSMAGVSISGLLIAGILPGLLLAVMLVGYVYWAIWRNPARAPFEEPYQASNRGVAWALVRLLPFSLVIFSVMGLILLGIATPSESAATGVFGSLVTAAFYRKLTWPMFKASLIGSVRINTMILAIISTSVLFGQLLAFTGATTNLIEWTTRLDVRPIVIFWMMMAVPFALCLFIDQLAFMLVAIPLYSPVVQSLGFDPIWFWTMFSINMTLASITPPFGYTMFALRAAAPDLIALRQVFAASWPIVWVLVVGMVIMTTFPGIVTTLPRLLK